MPSDFSNQGIALDEAPDFSTSGIALEEPERDLRAIKEVPSETPARIIEPPRDVTAVPYSPEQEHALQQNVNIALQRIDPRWSTQPPEPTIGRLIGQGMEWFNRNVKAPEEPMPAPLTPIVAPPAVEETPEALNRRLLAQSLYSAEHPIKAGVGQSAEKLMTTMAEPAGPLAVAATPLAPGVMLPIWATMGTEGSLDAIQRIEKARQTGNRAAYYEAAADLAINAPMVTGPFLHGGRAPAIEMPRSLAALGRELVRSPVAAPETLPVPELAPSGLPHTGARAEPLIGSAPLEEGLATAHTDLTSSGQPFSPADVLAKAASDQGVENRGRASAKTLSDILEPVASLQKENRPVDAETQRSVMSGMADEAHNSEIAQAIIRLVPVDVMHNLVGAEFTTKMLLDDPSVLQRSLAANVDKPIAAQFLDSLIHQQKFTLKGKDYAIQKFGSETQIRGLPAQPGINEGQVPAQVGPEGVPFSEQGAGTAAGVRGGIEEKAQAEVPLTESIPLEEAPATQVETVAVPVESAVPEGPGAATPAEFDPKKPFETSIKNAITAEKRAIRGMPAVEEEAARARPEVWEAVKAEIAEDPGLPDRLVLELRDKPRAITDREDAILLHQQVSLEEMFNRTTQDMVRLADTNSEAIPEYRIRLGQLSDQLLKLYDVDKSAGRETARGLAARKMLADETYSLVRMEMAKRAMNDGRPLTDTERTEITGLKEKIDATQKAFDEHVAKAETRIRELEAQHAADELKIAAMREAKADAASGTVRDLGAERDSIVAGLGSRASTPLRDLRPWIRKLALNLILSGITERDALINAVHDVLKDIFPTIERRDTMDAISGYGDFRPLDPEVAKAKLRDLSGQMQNVSKLEDLLGRRALQKTGPERKTLSDEERRLIKLVNEYKKRYGVVVTDPATQLKSALAAVKTRLTNQIKDLEFQIGTGKKIVKGATKVAYDAEAAELLARRDALKAQFDEVFGKPELTDAQRIAMATKALEKSIEDLRQRIATGDIGPRRTVSKTPVTPELESLRQQRDMALEQLQALRDLADPKKTPEEISLAALKTRLLNANFELHRRIREGDFSKRVRKSVALDPEAQRLKAENLKLRENFQRDLLKDRLKHLTKGEQLANMIVKMRRFTLLSSPVTLGKLTAAAIQRMIFTPIEEAIGAGWGAIPGFKEVAQRARFEGGFNPSAETKAIKGAFTSGMKDAWDTIRPGGPHKSQLEILYGGRTPEGGFKEGSLMPRSWMDFMGELHGALKAPVKRAAFERALEKRIEFGRREGVDVTDPITIASYALDSYREANRSIFLQDNALVSRINSFLAKRIDPRTGRPTTESQITSTVGRTLLPITRVPTNIVAEAMQYATGWATGPIGVGRALRRGIETLRPEEADLIMRQLKKGSIGLAFLTAGYLLPEFIGGYYQPHEKRAKGDVKVGDIRVPGVTLPKFAGGPDVPQYTLHNPLLETLQIGSTVRRVADSSLTKKHPEEQGVGAGLLAGVLGMAEEVPALREMVEITKAFEPRSRGAFIGELTKSLVIPQAFQWFARWMDKDTEGDVIPRKPTNTLEHIETGVPGLRESVPEPKRSR